VNKNGQFEEVFKESAGSISETKRVQLQEFIVNLANDGSEGLCYLVIDTAGFGDTQLSNKEVLQLLKELVQIIGNDGINQILFVSGGRFTQGEIDVYRLLESVIFDQEVADYTTIVRTRFPEFTNETRCEEDRQKLRAENSELFSVLRNSKVIYVDNLPLIGLPASIEAAKESRGLSRDRLLLHLAACQGKTYKPGNLEALQQRIGNYQTKTEQLQKELQEKEQARQQREAQLQEEIRSSWNQKQLELNLTR